MILGQFALVAETLFAGAAFYINIAEQPARLTLDDPALLAQWKPSYKRGFAMQASLAVAGFLLGAGAWWEVSHPAWLVGAFILVANWPFTLFIIMPTNNRLMGLDPKDAGPESRALIERWGRLHAIRTALGFAAAAIFFWASLLTT